MTNVLHILGIIIMMAGFLLAPISIFIFAYQFSKGRPLAGIKKKGVIAVTLFVVGLALSTFTEDNYWDRQQQTVDEERENQEIANNIEENYQAAEDERQKMIEENDVEMEYSFATPEPMQSNAQALNYTTVQENLENYLGVNATFSGVIQTISPTESYTYLELNVMSGSTDVNAENILVVEFPGPVSQYKGDVVQVYGTIHNGATYMNKNGESIIVPVMQAELIK
ncbi:hypothetical protein ACFW35_02355 [Fictibacillus sp. NPDC058756]|uniref:hypothetical protein n=1 Tax=Fictibacillus sp. NPDC058756 TaxID=3346625 RepID=UPI0036C86E3E